jgi:8-oxo-dGTP pyrophosphatase MutT (NUDIX family)
MIKKIIRFSRPIILPVVYMFWYISKPNTRGTKVVIVNEDKILLIKNTYGYGWTLPGGGIKTSEEPEQAAIREVFEEVGITIAEIIEVDIFTTNHQHKKDTIYAYCTKVQSQEYSLDTFEIETACWFKLNNLPKVGPITKKIITAYESKNILFSEIF